MAIKDQELLDALVRLDHERARIEAEMRSTVSVLRDRTRRVPWALIGEALGLSAQGAQQRYRASAPRERYRARRP